MNIHEKLLQVQSKLNAPKSQYNSFGKYHYRSLEDINEALKPLLMENGLSLVLKDTPFLCGERVYIQAAATLTDTADPEQKIETTAYAREADDKKGMDASQVTGATSSYARKYCLNGLFAIDDTKDADATQGNNGEQRPAKNQSAPKSTKKNNTSKNLMTQEQVEKVKALASEDEPFNSTPEQKNETVKKVASVLGISTKSTTADQFETLWKQAMENDFNDVYAAFEEQAAEANGG